MIGNEFSPPPPLAPPSPFPPPPPIVVVTVEERYLGSENDNTTVSVLFVQQPITVVNPSSSAPEALLASFPGAASVVVQAQYIKLPIRIATSVGVMVTVEALSAAPAEVDCSDDFKNLFLDALVKDTKLPPEYFSGMGCSAFNPPPPPDAPGAPDGPAAGRRRVQEHPQQAYPEQAHAEQADAERAGRIHAGADSDVGAGVSGDGVAAASDVDDGATALVTLVSGSAAGARGGSGRRRRLLQDGCTYPSVQLLLDMQLPPFEDVFAIELLILQTINSWSASSVLSSSPQAVDLDICPVYPTSTDISLDLLVAYAFPLNQAGMDAFTGQCALVQAPDTSKIIPGVSLSPPPLPPPPPSVVSPTTTISGVPVSCVLLMSSVPQASADNSVRGASKTSQKKDTAPIIIIVSVVVASACLACCLFLGAMYYRRRKRRQREEKEEPIEAEGEEASRQKVQRTASYSTLQAPEPAADEVPEQVSERMEIEERSASGPSVTLEQVQLDGLPAGQAIEPLPPGPRPLNHRLDNALRQALTGGISSPRSQHGPDGLESPDVTPEPSKIFFRPPTRQSMLASSRPDSPAASSEAGQRSRRHNLVSWRSLNDPEAAAAAEAAMAAEEEEAAAAAAGSAPPTFAGVAALAGAVAALERKRRPVAIRWRSIRDAAAEGEDFQVAPRTTDAGSAPPVLTDNPTFATSVHDMSGLEQGDSVELPVLDDAALAAGAGAGAAAAGAAARRDTQTSTITSGGSIDQPSSSGTQQLLQHAVLQDVDAPSRASASSNASSLISPHYRLPPSITNLPDSSIATINVGQKAAGDGAGNEPARRGSLWGRVVDAAAAGGGAGADSVGMPPPVSIWQRAARAARGIAAGAGVGGRSSPSGGDSRSRASSPRRLSAAPSRELTSPRQPSQLTPEGWGGDEGVVVAGPLPGGAHRLASVIYDPAPSPTPSRPMSGATSRNASTALPVLSSQHPHPHPPSGGLQQLHSHQPQPWPAPPSASTSLRKTRSLDPQTAAEAHRASGTSRDKVSFIQPLPRSSLMGLSGTSQASEGNGESYDAFRPLLGGGGGGAAAAAPGGSGGRYLGRSKASETLARSPFSMTRGDGSPGALSISGGPESQRAAALRARMQQINDVLVGQGGRTATSAEPSGSGLAAEEAPWQSGLPAPPPPPASLGMPPASIRKRVSYSGADPETSPGAGTRATAAVPERVRFAPEAAQLHSSSGGGGVSAAVDRSNASSEPQQRLQLQLAPPEDAAFVTRSKGQAALAVAEIASRAAARELGAPSWQQQQQQPPRSAPHPLPQGQGTGLELIARAVRQAAQRRANERRYSMPGDALLGGGATDDIDDDDDEDDGFSLMGPSAGAGNGAGGGQSQRPAGGRQGRYGAKPPPTAPNLTPAGMGGAGLGLGPTTQQDASPPLPSLQQQQGLPSQAQLLSQRPGIGTGLMRYGNSSMGRAAQGRQYTADGDVIPQRFGRGITQARAADAASLSRSGSRARGAGLGADSDSADDASPSMQQQQQQALRGGPGAPATGFESIALAARRAMERQQSRARTQSEAGDGGGGGNASRRFRQQPQPEGLGAGLGPSIPAGLFGDDDDDNGRFGPSGSGANSPRLLAARPSRRSTRTGF